MKSEHYIDTILLSLITVLLLSVVSDIFGFHQIFTFINGEVTMTFLLLFILITYVTIKKLLSNMKRNEHLKSVLSIIRDVNQLIVREKELKTLLQKSCAILESNHVYENVWIIRVDDHDAFEACISNDTSQHFTAFEKKVREGWTPHCIDKTRYGDGDASSVLDVSECEGCPLSDQYGQKSAFNVALKYDEKVYGYLNFAIDKHYTQSSEELALFEEIAGDIAYAIYNLSVENRIAGLKELYDNAINSLENIIFVKDRSLTYIACNVAFEKLLGLSKAEIIGKHDYDLFPKEESDLFRHYDKRMLDTGHTQSNYEWVQYPDGRDVYLLTTKSPLFDSNGAVIGLVGNSVDMTENKKNEEKLELSNKRFKLAERIGTIGSWEYDIKTGKFWGSEQSKAIYGLPRDTLNFTTELIERCIPERERVHQALLDLIEKEIPYNLEFEINPIDGSPPKIIASLAEVQRDSSGNDIKVVGSIQDITKRKKIEKELQQKKQELETIIQNAPNPIMIHNEEGKVILINKVWEELTGYTYADIDTIEKWTQHVYGEAMSAVKEHVDKLYTLDHKANDGQFSIKAKNGETLIWQFSSAPLGYVNGSRTVISSAMDVTELKQKDELMILQSRHAAMGEMISMIAHQWRQPLSVIAMDANNMLLDIALEEHSVEETETLARNILLQTQHLSKTIDDFRNFFKPDKEVSKIKVSGVLDETYAIVKESLAHHNIEYSVSYESDNELNAYPRELMQVFVNIINNAKDALIIKGVDKGVINVRVYDDDSYVTIEICDNATGIDKAIMPNIFDPYFTTKDEKTGTGLGLYMSKMIIESHLHGKIEVFNNAQGACFKVKLLKN
jgi:PAS domain S-box-containing protein